MGRLFFVLGLLFIFLSPPAWAQLTQYPDPNRQTTWNNFTDGIHTLGKNPTQASVIKRHLHYLRRQARLKSIKQAQLHATMQGQ